MQAAAQSLKGGNAKSMNTDGRTCKALEIANMVETVGLPFDVSILAIFLIYNGKPN